MCWHWEDYILIDVTTKSMAWWKLERSTRCLIALLVWLALSNPNGALKINGGSFKRRFKRIDGFNKFFTGFNKSIKIKSFNRSFKSRFNSFKGANGFNKLYFSSFNVE